MSDIPKGLVALSSKGEVVCAECVAEDPSLLDAPDATVVLSSDNWKYEVFDEDCAVCGLNVGEVAGG